MSYPEKRAGAFTGRWYGEVAANGRHRRFRRPFNDKQTADLYEDHIRRFNSEPEWANPDGGDNDPDRGPTLGEAFAAAKRQGGPKGKWKRERDHSGPQNREFVVRFLGEKRPLADLTSEDFYRLIENLELRPGRDGEQLSPKTINRYLSALSAILNVAANHKPPMIKVQPKLPFLPEEGGRIWYFTEEMEAAVVRWLREQGWLAEALTVRVLAASGLRWGEFARLSRNDVTEPRQLGQVVVSIIQLDKTKTDTARNVPLPPELGRELRAMLATDSQPIYRTMRQRLAMAVKSCGYEPQLTIHTLRHTTATRLALQGYTEGKIQRLLGHKNIKTTLRYVHLNDSSIAEMVMGPWGARGRSANNTGTGD